MMIEYNPEFLEKTSFLGKAQSDNLRAICADIDLNEIIANIENRILPQWQWEADDISA